MDEKYIVVGAAGGVGSALSALLEQQGAAVARVTRQEADASDFDALRVAVDRAVETLGGLDGIANCVGSIFFKPAHTTSFEEYSRVIADNLTAAFATVRAAVPHLNRGGSIVLTSSVAAGVGLANHDAIAAAKGGVSGLIKSAAATYAVRGVRVNGVAPGLVHTPGAAQVFDNELSLKASVDMHALGRPGEPQEVAELMAYLLGSKAAWITGQVIGIDGGLGAVKRRPHA